MSVDTNVVFALFIVVLVLQRLSELAISKRNEKKLRARGAVEFGASHYKYIVMTHVLFIVSMIAEYAFSSHARIHWWLIAVAVLLQMLRVWTVVSLGIHWTTKILVVPNAPLIQTGPYKFMRHPNYAVVIVEMLVLPLAFNLWVTSIVFSLLNAAAMTVRIRAEDQALGCYKR